MEVHYLSNKRLENPHRIAEADRELIKPWAGDSSVRRAFLKSCKAASLPRFNPHSVRHFLVHLAHQFCRTERDHAAWSHNLGHENLRITRNHYAKITDQERDEVFGGLTSRPSEDREEMEMMLRLHDHCYPRGTPKYERAQALWDGWRRAHCETS